MTTQEMMHTKCKPGYWWVNVAAIDEAPDWQEQVQVQESGLLFGYKVADLLAKQYKKGN